MTKAATAETAFAQFAQRTQFGALDGLRAAAITMVVWHHSTTGSFSLPMATRGYLGVDLFFIISGFLIVTLLLRERESNGDISLRNFYIRRSLRIFPAYALLLLIVAVMLAANPGGTNADGFRHDLPFALFFIANFVPMYSLLSITWSLSVEEQFYLIAPALEKYMPRSAWMVLLPAYVLVSLPALGYFPDFDLPSFFRETTFGPIILGVMLAHALASRRSFDYIFGVLGKWHAPLIALTLLIAATGLRIDDMSGWPRIAVHWAMLILIAACVIHERHILMPVLRLKPIVRIGQVSYGIYLYHLLAQFVIFKTIQRAGVSNIWIIFVGNAIVAWVLAEISYRFIEKPFLAMRSRFAARQGSATDRLSQIV